MPQPIRVLIVEDLASDAELIVRELHRGGLVVDWRRVRAAEELRSTLTNESWDVVLSDYSIPGFGAAQALEIVRSRDGEMPFIVVSGSVGEEVAVEMMRAGANDYVLKDAMARLGPIVSRELRESGKRRAAEQLSQNVLNSLSSHIAVLDQRGTIVAVNSAWNSFAARHRPLSEAGPGTPYLEICRMDCGPYAESAPLVVQSIEQVLQGELPQFVLEYQCRATSPAKWFLLHTTPLSAKRSGVVIAHTDITARKQAEAALQESEERYRTLLERIPAPLFVYDRETLRYLAVNAAAVSHYGYSREEFLQLKITDIRPPEDVPALLEVIKNRTEPYELTGMRRHRKKDGKIIDVEITAHSVDLAGRSACIILAIDVTKRLQADAEVRRTTELLRAIADSTPDALFVKDREGRYLLFNPAASRFVGLPVEEVLGRDDGELFGARDAQFIMARDRNVMETGLTQTEEERLTAAGFTRVYLATKTPYRDSEGKIAGVIGISRDITDRKRVEEDLMLFRALIDQTTDGIEVIDPATGRYLDVNQTACLNHGYSREEFLSLTVADVDPNVSGIAWDQAVAARSHGGSQIFESTHRRKDGSEFAVEVNLNFVRLDRDYLLAVVRDITERKRAQADLRMRDRAIRAVTQGILITDARQPDNPIIYASPGFERMTGYFEDDVLGRNCRLLQGVDTDPAVIAVMREAIRAGIQCTVELLNYRKDGSPFWNELSISPVWDSADELSHFVGVLADVTARRRLEEQLRQSQKMEAVGQLAGGVAHDFNNLLTVILGYSDIVRETLNRDDAAFELVGEISQAGERAASLTRQLLAFSRRQVLQPVVLDLNAVTRELEKMLHRLISEDIRLMTIFGPQLGLVRADPGQIEQVIVNLVVNAKDAMPHGGRLTIETRNVKLDQAYVLNNTDLRQVDCVMLSVSDTGHGIPEEIRSRIFEPFFTTKEIGKGTGLGLATVHGILKQSGGHIDVESEVGRGTTFKVYLPRAEITSQEPETQRGLPSAPRGSATVLLVEDEPGVRALMGHVLKGCGYTVLEASGGEDAARVVSAHTGSIQLLITDVVMPGIGGWQVAEWLRKQYADARVLFVSGYTDDAVVRHGVQQEGANFLHKPFSSYELATKVRDVLKAEL